MRTRPDGRNVVPPRLWLALALGSLTAVLFSVSVGVGVVAAAAEGSTVRVDTLAELRGAIDDGARRILVAPGDYSIKKTIDLADVKLVGQGRAGSGNGVNFVVDSTSPQLAGTAVVSVAGTVLIENISFKGLLDPVLYWVASAPATAGRNRHQITIRDSRFVSKDFEGARVNFVLGNVQASPSTGKSPLTQVIFTDNYVKGGYLGLTIGNFSSTAPGARVIADVRRNEFHVPYTTILVVGQLSGRNGTVRGSSSRNVVHDTGDGYGLNVIGGSDDPFAPGSPGVVR